MFQLKAMGLVTLLAFGTPLSAESLSLGIQRQLFEQAERLADTPKNPNFLLLKSQLKDYPLYPYLEYEALKDRLSSADKAEIDTFLKANQDSVVGEQLLRRWLGKLAEGQRWQDYLAYYQPSESLEHRCHQANALVQTGKAADGYALAPDLWLRGDELPDACDPLFKSWLSSPGFEQDLIWQRIALAMDKGNIGLANALKNRLKDKDKNWVDTWVAIYRKPDQALEKLASTGNHPYKGQMVSSAARRLVQDDALAGIKLWQQAQKLYELSAEVQDYTNRKLATSLLRAPETEAWEYLLSIKPLGKDDELRPQLIRAALYRQQWPQALEWLSQLPEAEQQDERWQYWKARALDATGQKEAAQTLFHKLSGERSYYGFLAADLENRDYKLAHAETPVSAEAKAQVDANPAIQRAGEFLALGRKAQAKREWRQVQKSLSQSELMAAASLAKKWGWLDQAIFTLAKTDYWDDLELRFPVEHKDGVLQQAQTQDLNPAWIYGVIRQESAFDAAVVSHAGAVGLMQLMPATAKLVAGKLKKKAPGKSELTDPDLNIQLGSNYLRDVLDQLYGNPVLATAAYNAGPSRVKRWLPETDMPADIWVELIPFSETRTYVQRVFTYASIYDYRLQQPALRISVRMPLIKGKKALQG